MLVGKCACLGLGPMGRLLHDVYIPIVGGDARLENGNGATMLRRSFQFPAQERRRRGMACC